MEVPTADIKIYGSADIQSLFVQDYTDLADSLTSQNILYFKALKARVGFT